MWNYEKRLQYPISISTPNAKMASFIISQYGGPDGEMGASMRYLTSGFLLQIRGLPVYLLTSEPRNLVTSK